MKYIILTITAFLFVFHSSAKKVKFAVDMTGQTISTNGVHVSGDFQTAAGFSGGDWSSSSTVLSQEGASEIYSIVVDIPAFQKYEYKYVNGDQFYEVEFVPIESRVGYNFNDNRWIYIDSLANDTTFIGALLFSGNAPAGKTLLRYYVNMSFETISSNGVHVITDEDGYNPTSNFMYTFGDNLYETILYTSSNSVNYAFVNGNSIIDKETIPTECASSGNRVLNVSYDTLLTQFCFGSCSACEGLGIIDLKSTTITIFPNPTSDFVTITCPSANIEEIIIYDQNGKILLSKHSNNKEIKVDCSQLATGTYFLSTSFNELETIHHTIIIK